ncbi:hypothetical protein GCM10009757_45010 [Streptomyces cheonanensis]|uniref:2-phospho-L-lactate guanylyltransferase n=2 Tax=Streptomyces TaxID=1883 RepID=A0ABP5H040_9ACTN
MNRGSEATVPRAGLPTPGSPARARVPAPAPHYDARMQATAYTFDADTRSGSVLLDDGTPVDFGPDAFAAGGLLLLRPGQRVRIETADGTPAGSITLVTLQTL